MVSGGGGQGESPDERAERPTRLLYGEHGRIARPGGPGSGDAARLDRVERQLAELQAEVARLKQMLSGARDRERGSDLLDSGLAAMADAAVWGDPGEHPSHAEAVLTVVAAATRSADHYYPGAIRRIPEVRVHVVVHAPAELHGWASGQPSPLREDAEKLVEGMRERLSEQAAGRVVDVVWAPATAGWPVVDFGGFDRMAGFPTRLDDWGHQQVGAWAAQVGIAAGLPPGVADGAGAVIRYLVPLPFDRALQDVSRVIQVAGILAFALPGGHVLACASLKSLVQDEITDLLAKQLRAAIWPEPPAPDPGQLRPARPGGQLASEPPADPPVTEPPPPAKPDDPGEQDPWHLDPGGGFSI